MWMWARQAMSTMAAGRIGPRPRIASQLVRVRVPAEEHGVGKPHHARSVSMSRSTRIASARSASSAATSSASARTTAAAFRRAASMSADRTAADTGVPSLVRTASARDASSSGRKVIVSATESNVLQNVRQLSSCSQDKGEYAAIDRSRYAMISGLSLRIAATVSRLRLRVAATTPAGVSASHWLSETSAKWSLRNSSSTRTGSSPTFSK
jgi:hypothetical protein